LPVKVCACNVKSITQKRFASQDFPKKIVPLSWYLWGLNMCHNLVIEPIPILEVFATGIAPIQHFGEFVRVIFYAEHRAANGERERVIVAKIVLPAGAFHVSAQAMAMIERPRMLT
jgi:hypothetical protein